MGEVQTEELQSDIPIQSTDSKIFHLEQMIGKFRDSVMQNIINKPQIHQ